MEIRATVMRCAVAALLVFGLAAPARADKIAMETASANSVVGIMPQSMVGFWAKDGVDVQLAMGQTLTKSLLKIVEGKLDAAVVPPPAYVALTKGVGPYKQLGEKAKAVAGNARALYGFPASFYHAIVWADGGIESWKDVGGKRIFIGPPAGVANAQITAMVKAGAGLDTSGYKPVKAPWGAATQNFQDGQFDVYVGSFGLGSQALAELSITRKIRILSLPEGKTEPPVGLGMAAGQIKPGTYPGQVNQEPVNTWQTVMMVMVNKDISDDVAYKLTKSYFEHVKALGKGNAQLIHLEGANPFAGVVAPLHPGALKYYKEAGITVPANLMAH